MTKAESDELIHQLRPVVNPRLVVLAEKDGKAIGFAVALPDFNTCLQRNRSGLLAPGLLRLVAGFPQLKRIRVLLFGTVSPYRGRGVAGLLFGRVWTNAHDLGYRWAEAGWVLEDNRAMINAIERCGLQRYKTLRIFEKALGRSSPGALQ